MKCYSVVAILAALPAWVSAVLITNSNFDGIEAGKTFTVTWSDATGPVTLTLKDGPTDNLQTVSEIVCTLVTSVIISQRSAWTWQAQEPDAPARRPIRNAPSR